MRLLTLLLSVCFALPLAGCAFGTRYVTLAYPPDRPAEETAAEVSEAAATAPMVNVVLSVTDARENRERIGAVRNGYGIVTTSILTEDNITVWIHDAIRTELQMLGYNVIEDVQAATSANSYDRLDAQLTKLYCDIFMFYDGEVTLTAMLQPAHGERLSGEFPAKVNSGLSWAATGKATGESLAQALQKSARAILATFGFAPRSFQ